MSTQSSKSVQCVGRVRNNSSKRDEDDPRLGHSCPDLERVFEMSSSDMKKFFANQEVRKALNEVPTKGNEVKTNLVPNGVLEDSASESQTQNQDHSKASKCVRRQPSQEQQGCTSQGSDDAAPASQGRQNPASARGQRDASSQNSPRWCDLYETKQLAVTDAHNIGNYFRTNILTTFGAELPWCLLNHVFLPVSKVDL
ncbi:hypothetical protein FHG87_017774 [Trinorchestia longiramus]|nr:hypothetical protein FHG87_017774 [Trinorchestia longiramus]